MVFKYETYLNYAERTRNMGKIASSNFGDTLGITILDNENNENIED